MKIKLVRKETLLEVFQIGERQLYNLEKEGIVVPLGGGYKLIESIKNYCEMRSKRQGGSNKEDVSLEYISEVLGIAERTARDLSSRGILVKEATGVYKLKESIEGYITYKIGDSEEGKNEILLKKKADRELRQITLLEKKGNLVDKSSVKEFLGGMLVLFRDRLEGLPDKIASGIKLDRDVKEALKQGIEEALEELTSHEYE